MIRNPFPHFGVRHGLPPAGGRFLEMLLYQSALGLRRDSVFKEVFLQDGLCVAMSVNPFGSPMAFGYKNECRNILLHAPVM